MKRTLRVLIVEDSEEDATMLLEILRRGGFDVVHLRVQTAEGMRAALGGQTWDVVVSDYSMPQFSGIEALAILKATGIDVPLIMASGTIDEEIAVEALKAGACDFLVKDRLARLIPAIEREIREAGERRARRTLALEVAKTNERVQFALQAAGVGIWESTFGSGHTMWSDIQEQLHGLPVAAFGGTVDAFIDCIHPDDRQGVVASLSHATRDRSDSRVEYRTRWPDGSIHWLTSIGRMFYDDQGLPVRHAGVGLDITAQKNLESRYQHAQKMEAIGRLAGGVAHDFNNLLTAILGYCELVLTDLDPRDRSHADVVEIQKAGRQAAGLTRQLLAFSRKEIIEPTRLDLNVVVADVREMLGRLIGEDVEIVLHLSPSLPPVHADRGQVEQIVMNLAINARDAMPTGGTLTIETANVELDEDYATVHFSVKPGFYVALTVSDTGTGITPEVQARLFEPFYTTKEIGKGTGLGLATVHGIVRGCGGSVGVYSEVGKGTSFKVYLPSADSARLVSDPTPSAARTHGGGETVLVVEDAEGLRELTTRLLQRQGYKVLVASNANEALQVFEQHAIIDVILTDVVMPGMSGPELTSQLIDRRPLVKVLYMSGYTEDAIVHHGVLKPGIAFLHKPFTSDALGRKVREVLDR